MFRTYITTGICLRKRKKTDFINRNRLEELFFKAVLLYVQVICKQKHDKRKRLPHKCAAAFEKLML